MISRRALFVGTVAAAVAASPAGKALAKLVHVIPVWGPWRPMDCGGRIRHKNPKHEQPNMLSFQIELPPIPGMDRRVFEAMKYEPKDPVPDTIWLNRMPIIVGGADEPKS